MTAQRVSRSDAGRKRVTTAPSGCDSTRHELATTLRSRAEASSPVGKERRPR